MDLQFSFDEDRTAREAKCSSVSLPVVKAVRLRTPRQRQRSARGVVLPCSLCASMSRRAPGLRLQTIFE
ncbi:hypothetical protein EMIHUDRAFT_362087 [Emiliania huxleyi CCMP1516]|uniref:Uncharacterized protein n=2 Tax=Emiliania huxleyi TaxID=2903 RepID=A0A0D3KP43_EMIH1|nr:hypothetical protein EMIHUDRAFT_368277 [Emiliania huxleyi CCMP1516]XP_005789957.1 hypothetical protein EMIHUDRAFT_362087 [Emiliania huxleyi CCMP1516]EOD22652.1 hypothetical protein EMIHUDRAFT_368277 [Emiliania huxleyi CCMP1516]EOD37528.1 hypothetical protein EMIHUDRAFT_362087 [Emiliania huxleyi CCMP1516]|eukprot:XP_005775081.1 hypothetical protein EMIHUDRAFT_368277 [Emiliania huxleyi CCMP1516]